MIPENEQYIGFDIGGTNFKAGTLFIESDRSTSSATLTNVKYTPSLAHKGFDISYNNLVDFISEYLQSTELTKIGIGFPSVVIDDGYIPVAPNLSGWEKIQLKKLLTQDLQKNLGRYIDVVIENDANTAAVAEMWAGNAIGIKSFLYITLGTGIGGAIIYEGKLLKGTTFSAGEIGHLIIDRAASQEDGIPDYRVGVLESYTGRNAVLKSYESQFNQLRNGNSILQQSKYDIKDIFDFALEKDDIAIEIVHNYIRDLSIGLASAVNLLGIPHIVIGGGVSNSLVHFFSELEQEIIYRLLPSNRNLLKLIHAHFQKDSGLIGSALLTKGL